MNTNKKIIRTTILAGTLFLTTLLTTYAIQWNQSQWNMHKGVSRQHLWNWNWKHLWKEKKSYHNEADLISSIPNSNLSEQEKKDLYYQYSEEMVARDAYNYFYNLYGTQTFQNIAQSEEQHMEAVKVLLDKYELSIPINYGELQTTFDKLKLEWEKWFKEALEVGLKIEMLDINDIVDTIKTTDNDDIKVVLTNIWWASYNHMRWFLQWLSNNGFSTTIDYSLYLDKTDLDSKWTLKTKLSEKLEKDWILLPVQAWTKAIQENCLNEQKQLDQIEKNKKVIEKKYGNTLKNMNSKKINDLNLSLDKSIENTKKSNSLSKEKKENSLNLYYSLKEYLSDLVK